MEEKDNVLIEKNKDNKTFKVTIKDSDGTTVYEIYKALEENKAILSITKDVGTETNIIRKALEENNSNSFTL